MKPTKEQVMGHILVTVGFSAIFATYALLCHAMGV
jgi:hypothetical protein